MTKLKAHHYPIKLMGCGFVFTAVDSDPQKAWDGIRAAVSETVRIEKLISSWDEKSQTSAINRNAGFAPVTVNRELYQLIERSIKVSELCCGAFDISGSLSRYYWNFDKKLNSYPRKEKIEELQTLINYKKIKLNKEDSSVYLEQKGMKIGFGGIGKGYAALMASRKMQDLGVESGLINASGDLMCWGSPPNKEHWDISIPNPKNKNTAIAEFSIPFGSIVSSGGNENYSLIDGDKYSHIIDPRTGIPSRCTNNVTVICPNPEFGDALATGISVLGHSTGINMVNKLEGVECIVTDADNNVHYSTNLKPISYDKK